MNNPNTKINTSVDLCGITLKTPVITASGTCGFGRELNEIFPVSELGAIAVKGLTLKKKEGNPAPRICETPSGILNSVGLQNPGVEFYLSNELPFLKRLGATVIANINGTSIDEYKELAVKIDGSDTDFIELNISCPNVKEGGVSFGTDPDTVKKITYTIKNSINKPLIVKLTPNVSDIKAIAKAAEEGGADALSMINTVLGMRIDINTRRPIMANKVGGLSGAAVRPIAVRMVWQTRQVTDLPIIGMGGIMNYEDALEFILAGANAVSVGTASMIKPDAAYKIKNDLYKYLIKNNINDINTLRGLAQ